MNGTAAAPGSSAFARGVLNFLEKTEYRRCDRGEDFEAICRLRFKAYDANGLLPPSDTPKIADSLDGLPNCHNFGVFYDGTLISTLRIHHLCREYPDGPSMAVYEDLLTPRLNAGERFVDPSRFASDPEWSAEYSEVPYVTLRLAWMACLYFEVPYCLSTIRPEHSAFYRRVYRSKQIGELRNYPRFTRKVGLYQADVQDNIARSYARYPFFRATDLEQRLLFDRPSSGAQAPLTILPTAGSLRVAA